MEFTVEFLDDLDELIDRPNGPQMELAYRLVTISQAQKTRDFQGPTPSHFPSKWIYTHAKH
jgi:hypothetical protein